ncbi:GPI-anchored cell wall beta-1,3-endoglucanase/siderophore iron transporter [Blumeria hordei DH14]|uniref:GPI-anchored cell wall beta-1,3-endoglucanase/siderophore iron transporter n=1 Tax=Blumeria graminis f. sp. hordei (strain DH14) TaxID=546991 RepID=N1JD69_BLUG1|nr:GPI-anchored cell wall beta-1,3-endoglucanase/siderophore iron transporter [Blumeria hordei DH14]
MSQVVNQDHLFSGLDPANPNKRKTRVEIDDGIEAGVNKIEAVTLVWTRKELMIAYLCIFLVFFVISLQQQIQSNVIPYVTSSFVLLPLTGTTSIVSSIVGGVLRLPTGKFIDLVGRLEGMIMMTIITTIGLSMMAATHNVRTFAAAQVFYWVGFDGMAYVMDVFMADSSRPKNRALVFAFSTAPYIITTFIGPRIAAIYLSTIGWPWAYGTFVIITPIATIPLLYILHRNERKARDAGILCQKKISRSIGRKVLHYLVEFDAVGLTLICAGSALLLLPFSLESYQTNGWGSGIIIAMLLIGIASVISFVIWERSFAPVSFIPFELLRNPSIWGACMLAILWDSNFLPFLQVVHGLSITNAGYVYNIYSIGSCLWALIFSGMIRLTGRFKNLALMHLATQVLGVGLMIFFRRPSSRLSYVIICQVLIACSSGGLVISEQMSVMMACPHRMVAVPLALLALFSSLGGAIGTTISTTIFTHRFTAALTKALPGNETLNALLYGDLDVQLSYPFGSPERDAVIYAYGQSMLYQTIGGTLALAPCLGFVAVWKNFQLKDLPGVRGNTL